MRPLFSRKLAALKSAASGIDLIGFADGAGFTFYLDHAACIHNLLPSVGRFEDYGTPDDGWGEPEKAEVLTVPLDKMLNFTRDITQHHSLALVDYNWAQPVCFARFNRITPSVMQQSPKTEEDCWD